MVDSSRCFPRPTIHRRWSLAWNNWMGSSCRAGSTWTQSIMVNSLMSANTFHVTGDHLFIADYWHGVHVFDIRKLDRPRYLETIKSPDRTFSAFSYGTSVSGYGRHIYKTAFGGVDIYEVNVPSDRPQGKLTVEWLKKGK